MALSKPNRLDYLWLAAALGLGLLMAWFDLHTDDDGIIVGLLLIFSGLLGMGRPYGAWRWALALGLCIPVAEFFNTTFGAHPQPLSQSLGSLAGILLANLVIAFVGVYAGAWLRRASS